MSCIANFYLDGIKYSLEDFDMSNRTTQNLLKKVIASAKLSVEESARLSINKKAQLNSVPYSDPVDLFSDGSLGHFDFETEEQETLTEADDEALLSSL